jgi:hypothetical protein
MRSAALLAGRIFDERGNRMTPSHVRKRGIKYRYYLSSALLQAQPERAGGVSRIPAAEIEGLVTRSVRDHLNQSAKMEDAVLINTHVARIEVQSDQLVIELADAKGIRSKRSRGRKVLKVSWRKSPSRRRREILVPASVPPQDARAIRSENRALLIASIARGRRWLDELITDPTASAESIATRDGCSVRKVNMTISLAFLAPDLVKAAIEGRLPHGMGVVRLTDVPAEWSRQHPQRHSRPKGRYDTLSLSQNFIRLRKLNDSRRLWVGNRQIPHMMEKAQASFRSSGQERQARLLVVGCSTETGSDAGGFVREQQYRH